MIERRKTKGGEVIKSIIIATPFIVERIEIQIGKEEKNG